MVPADPVRDNSLMDTPDLATILKQEMKRAGFNDYSLAIASGLKEDVIRDIMRGKSKSPAAERVEAIARVLGRTSSQLLGLDPIPSEPKTSRSDEPGQYIKLPAEIALIALWRTLSGEEQRAILADIASGRFQS